MAGPSLDKIFLFHDQPQRLAEFQQTYQNQMLGWETHTKPETAIRSYSRRAADLVIFPDPIAPAHEEFIRELSASQMLDYLALVIFVSSGDPVPGWFDAAPVRGTLPVGATLNEFYEKVFTMFDRATRRKKKKRIRRRQLEAGRLSDVPLGRVLEGLMRFTPQFLVWVSGNGRMGKVIVQKKMILHSEFAELEGLEAFDAMMSLSQGNYAVQLDPQTLYPQTMTLRTIAR